MTILATKILIILVVAALSVYGITTLIRGIMPWVLMIITKVLVENHKKEPAAKAANQPANGNNSSTE